MIVLPLLSVENLKIILWLQKFWLLLGEYLDYFIGLVLEG
jgi:hypothetical protein